ncbi:Tetratricopeptide-like helical domain containing protein [Trema orientale]|uniref:Tetratricopeptide-like helical domain containing protein n=1 Tax=Trema orientale TaxID=63057 RepID=A0A2P5EQE9_TREOI|nr:Tetratricopeptide-like helical domain containing protein [Trema orientale]
MSSSSSHSDLKTLLDSARPFLRGELESVNERLPSLVRSYARLARESAGTSTVPSSTTSSTSTESSSYGEPKTQFAFLASSTLPTPTPMSTSPSSTPPRGATSFRDTWVKPPREEAWRKKVRSLVPANGIVVKQIKTGEDVVVSRRLEPGDGKPGLWMSSISRMGALYSLLVREEAIFGEERKRVGGEKVDEDRDEDLELVIPPVFENCTRVLDAGEQIKARDLYWEAVCDSSKRGLERAEELLLSCVEKNPFVGEPHVVLGQLYLSKGRFEEAEREAEKGLTLILQWGSPWDKRMSWEGWISWARVLLMKAKEKSWPRTSWGIINLGLIK